MSDEADISQERMEREAELRKKFTPANTLEVEATGFCLNCGEGVPTGHRWCDKECQVDWTNRRNK